MLDPYIRRNMTIVNGTYEANFKLPDVYGMFTFRVVYRRHGYSYISSKDTVQVRPYRHDQYPRFLVIAYPYYANIFSMMISFVIFSVFFLYSKDTAVKEKAE